MAILLMKHGIHSPQWVAFAGNLALFQQLLLIAIVFGAFAIIGAMTSRYVFETYGLVIVRSSASALPEKGLHSGEDFGMSSMGRECRDPRRTKRQMDSHLTIFCNHDHFSPVEPFSRQVQLG